MLKAGEGQEMLEMLKRAVETAVETQRTKEAKNLRMLLGQMHTLQVSYLWFSKFTTKRKISEGLSESNIIISFESHHLYCGVPTSDACTVYLRLPS